jgi:ketosteroid isomerase-like protein
VKINPLTLMAIFPALVLPGTWYPAGQTVDQSSKSQSCPVSPASLPTDRFLGDMRTKNIRDVLALYTPNAVFIDPSGKRYRGSGALRGLYKKVFATFDSDLVMKEQTLLPGTHPQVCIESGVYDEDLRLRSNGSVHHYAGSYRFTYELQSTGQWLLSRMEWTVR